MKRNYGNLSLGNKITIIGPGYFLSENPYTHIDKKQAKFNRLYINPGSEGSEIYGLSLINNEQTKTGIFIRNMPVFLFPADRLH